MVNCVDLDQMPKTAACDLDLHCLQRPNCPNTKNYYDCFEIRIELVLIFLSIFYTA